MMDKAEKSVLEKYRELQDIHHKALHELAGAAQIIKSYEYLEKHSKAERILFDKVLSEAIHLCAAGSFEVFEQNRQILIQAIHDYQARTTGENGKSHIKPSPHLST